MGLQSKRLFFLEQINLFMPIEIDSTYLFFLGILLFFVVGLYLFVRRVLLNFRRGIEEGRR